MPYLRNGLKTWKGRKLKNELCRPIHRIYEFRQDASKKQLIHVYEGSLKENETWLSEFGALVKVDKNCIRKLLYDREPKKSRCSFVNEERLKYVRELAGRILHRCFGSVS